MSDGGRRAGSIDSHHEGMVDIVEGAEVQQDQVDEF